MNDSVIGWTCNTHEVDEKWD